MSPDVILYLAFCFTNVLLYTCIKLFSLKSGLTTLQIASYMNIGVFVLYNIFFAKKIWKLKLYSGIFKPGSIIFCVSALSALTKLYCIQYIEPRDAVIISHTTPFLVMLFASIFLKEKMVPKYWICGAFSLCGVCVYVWHNPGHSFYYLILLLHVAFKAIMHIATKKRSKQSVFAVMFYDNFFYTLLSLVILKTHGGIEAKYFLNSYILLITAITIISLFCLVKAYSIAFEGISKLQNLDFSKIIFSFPLATLLLKDKISLHELSGVGVILISIIISQVNFNFGQKRQKDHAIGKAAENI